LIEENFTCQQLYVSPNTLKLEKPNTSYIDQLSVDDIAFKNKFINLIKKELTVEIDSYKKAISNKEYLKASQLVHRLKHKVSILGLKKGYNLALDFENELKENTNSFASKEKFDKMLNKMVKFLECL
tara:strand:+ start:210742 stop:211122 length:381 start_codon:yes stop_codon:yes gene_type:complete